MSRRRSPASGLAALACAAAAGGIALLGVAHWTDASLLWWLAGWTRPIVVAGWILALAGVAGWAATAGVARRLPPHLPRAAIAPALGCALLALGVLGLGALGLATARGLTLAALAASVALLPSALGALRAPLGAARAAWSGATSLSGRWQVSPRTLVLAAAVAPFVWGALAPPTHYDVLEYHLGGPSLWLEEGRLRPQPGNFYTALPASMEALNLLGLALGGPGTDARFARPGLVAAGLLHVALLGVFLALADRVFRVAGVRCRALRLAGLLLLLAFEPMYQVASEAKNDLAPAVWYLVAWLLLAGRRPRPLAAGLALGAGLGAKITLLTLGLGPLAVAAAVVGAASAGAGARTWRARSGGAAWAASLLLAGALLAFLPWAARGALATGYPLFPSTAIEVPAWARGAAAGGGPALEWNAALARTYAEVHLARLPWEAGWGRQWVHRLGDWGWGWAAGVAAALLLGAAEIAAARGRRRGGAPREGVALLLGGLLALAATAAWSVLGTSPVRFLLPVMPLALAGLLAGATRLAASVPAAGRPAVNRALVGAALVVAAGRWIIVAATAAHQSPAIVALDGTADARIERALFGEQAPPVAGFLAAEDVARGDSGAEPVRVLLLFEARGAHLPVSWATVTVHDAFPDAWGSVARLRAAGFTHLLVNEVELLRLARFYPPDPAHRLRYLGDPRTPPPPPGVPGSREHYASWLPWRAGGRPEPALLDELPALRTRAVLTSPDLSPAGHRIWLVAL